MGILKSMNSILFHEGILNFLKRKANKTFLDNRTLFTINYRNRKTKIYLNKKFGYVDQYIFDNGIYEKDILDTMFDYLLPEKTMLDIGGNIGQHSLLLAPYCKKIIAFEPIPDIYAEFKNSIAANNYNNIELHNTAISDEKTEKTIFFSSKNAGSSSFLTFLAENRIPIQVQTDKLENVIPKNVKIDVVKIDVEGFEAKVILGNKEFFERNKPVIFLEFCPSNIDSEGSFTSEELVNFFRTNQYEIFSHGEHQNLDYNNREAIFRNNNWICKPA